MTREEYLKSVIADHNFLFLRFSMVLITATNVIAYASVLSGFDVELHGETHLIGLLAHYRGNGNKRITEVGTREYYTYVVTE